MLEGLLDMVKGGLTNHLQDHPDTPNDMEQNSQASEVVGQSILEQLSGLAKGGDFSGIKEMFSGQDTDAGSPMANSLTDGVVGSLMSKLGLNSGMAKTIAAAAIPFVLNMFNKQTNSSGLNIGNLISQFTGGGNQSQGAGGLGDLISGFLGGGGNQGGGGIMDTIKGMFGK